MINIINIIFFYFIFGIKYNIKDELNEFDAYPRRLMQDNTELLYVTDRAHMVLIYAFSGQNDGTKYYSSLTELISLIHKSYTFVGRSKLSLLSAHNTPTLKWTDNIGLEELQLSRIPPIEKLKSGEDIDMRTAISYSAEYLRGNRVDDVNNYFMIIFTESGAYNCKEASIVMPYPWDNSISVHFIDYNGGFKCGYELLNCNSTFSCPGFQSYNGSRINQVNNIKPQPFSSLTNNLNKYKTENVKSVMGRAHVVFVFDQTREITPEISNIYSSILEGMNAIFRLGEENQKMGFFKISNEINQIIGIRNAVYDASEVQKFFMNYMPVSGSTDINSGLIKAVNAVDPQPSDDNSIKNKIIHLILIYPIIDAENLQNTIQMAINRGIHIVIHVVCPRGEFAYDGRTLYPEFIEPNYNNVYMTANAPLTLLAQMERMVNQIYPLMD